MAQQSQGPDPSDRIFQDLRSKNEEVKYRAAEWSPERFAAFNDKVSTKVRTLIQSPDSNDKASGALAIDRLIDCDAIGAGEKASKYSNYLRAGLLSNDYGVLDKTARALGRLARPGGAYTAELVEAEMTSAFEWLQTDKQESRKLAAVLIIREMAKNSPTLVYGFIPQIFDVIWNGLKDPRDLIRKIAAEAISACFEVMAARDSNFAEHWFKKVYNQAVTTFSTPNATIDEQHGALLILKELLIRGPMMKNDAFYPNACEIVLRLKDHRDAKIRALVVQVIPSLAEYNPIVFTRDYLHKSMIYLQAQLKREKERNGAFIAIGAIAKSVGGAMAQYLDGIILYIRESLSTKTKNRQAIDEGPMFSCISMLSLAVGQTLSKYMEVLLDPIFACGLTKPLEQALIDMAHYIPPIRATIQEKLLDLLSLILVGSPYRPLGCPENRMPPVPAFAKDYGVFPTEHTNSEIVLALSTLGTFDFSGHILNEFVRDVTIRYADSEAPEIRKAAALTCCQLFVQDPIVYQTSTNSIQVVSEVIDKLLTVGVGDPEPEIRRTVLNALDRKFDRHLARPENVRCLFLAVNDEVFAVRESAIIIIGRLTAVNPAYVFPPLRKLLVNLLTGLGYSNTARQKEENARLICLFVSNATKLIKTYVEPMVSALLPKATDPNAAVASTTITALGELATVGGQEMVRHIPELMPIIIEALQDLGSQAKRDAAMHTLGSLAIHSGYVIDPYLDYPELLVILINIIKTEAHEYLRQDAIKLVGVLGALDPYKFQQLSETVAEKQSNTEVQAVSDVALLMQGLTPSNDEYYPTVVINTLMQTILQDHSLVQYHGNVIDAIVTIFKTIGIKCVPFLGQIIPGFLSVIRSSHANRLDSYFNQLAILVSIVKQHIRVFLPEIIEVVREFWSVSRHVQSTILSLVEAICKSLEGEFKRYLAGLLPLMLAVIERDTDVRRESSVRILHTFLVFGSSGEEYMHLIIPAIVGMFENTMAPVNSRKVAIDTLSKLCRQVNVTDFASLMIHPLAKVMATPTNKALTGTDERPLKVAALDCVCSLVFHLNQDFIHYIPLVNKAAKIGQVSSHNYDLLVTRLQKGESLPQDLYSEEQYGPLGEDSSYTGFDSKKLPVNQQHLKNAWESSQKSTREDWQEWMRRFSVELLKESPSHALRACANLAGVYQPLAKDLFNSAFASCWTELYDQYQEELVRSIERALTSTNIPPDILQILLNLAEFMEHDDKALPIDIRTLGRFAAKCHAFAKALHYKELEFEQEQNGQSVEALITINNQLQQSDAAIGILRRAQFYGDVELKEAWFEKLQRWEEALAAYQRRELVEPGSFDIVMGKMRCLHALGEWRMLSEIAQEHWPNLSTENRVKMSALAAAAAWGRGEWDLMDTYINVMKEKSPDRAFFGSILAIQRNHFEDAQRYIVRAREGVNSEITATIGESYNRAYNVVVRTQMLAELEEIITYKQSMGNFEKLESLRALWNKRLLGCQQNVEVWQRMLKVRALILTPKENPDIWIKFANLCRKSNRMGLAERSLASLGGMGEDGTQDVPPQVAYARLKFNWATGNHHHALSFLKDFTASLSEEHEQYNATLQNSMHGDRGNGANGLELTGQDNLAVRKRMAESAKFSKLLAKCYLRQGDWQAFLLRGDWMSDKAQEGVRDILESYRLATEHNQTWYKAWHAWALANFEVVTSMTLNADQDRGPALPEHIILGHVVPAIQGFFKSIALSKTSSLQDTLRLLTLWFAHGGNSDVNQAVNEGFTSVSIDTWLEVIPQLIARINQPNPRVRSAVHRLLAEVGKVHPQALVYPLTVAMKSNVARRSHSATQIMDSMRIHSPRLVEQADLVSHELMRVAVLWHELWHEGLEEASRLYFGDHNVEGMFATLAPLHELLDNGAETLREVSFAQAFGHDLAEARHFCNLYRQTKEVGDLNQAWDLYYAVFRKIARQLPQLMSLDLRFVSPRLKEAHDLSLAVPGTYHSGKPVIRIVSFDPIFTVIPSKQRPRKMALRGSDGLDYSYVLKGHEDIRQDERVMQLFGLVNTLLNNDTESFKRHLNIQKFPAIPLSQNSGLLGWVPNSDTLHNLIKEYRESRRILLNIEHRIMLQMAPDYDNLTLMQKVEVFGYAMDNTTGKDLYRVLWLKSKSSESWLERRTNYTRSLGVMSMVGYILGLGDRHPSNLMLDRVTGKIIHIDFGDCFEVAMHREKYPERVPFRLTRMLTFAMEVSNIEGSFRITCEAVMRVIRENKESLMAVLEAFIHDPLLNWRLNTRESPPRPHFKSERRASIIDVPNQGSDSPGTTSAQPGNPYRHRRSSVLEALVGSTLDAQGGADAKEVQNARALQVLARVKEKLTGKDFGPKASSGSFNNGINGMGLIGDLRGISSTGSGTTELMGGLQVSDQVDRLLRQATDVENLCQHYIGWCSFWPIGLPAGPGQIWRSPEKVMLWAPVSSYGAGDALGDESIRGQSEEMSVSNSVMSEDTPPQAAEGQGSINGTPAPNSQTPGHPSFRRQRASRACETCHARKVRCDAASLGVPCTNCVAFAIECKIPVPKRKKTNTSRAKDEDSEADSATPHSPSTDPRVSLVSYSGHLSVTQPRSNVAYNSPDGLPSTQLSDAQAAQEASNNSTMAQFMRPKFARAPIKEAGRVAYLGESSNLSLLVKDRHGTTDVVHYPLPENIRGANARLTEPDQVEIDILQQRGAFLLPPKALCDELVECYFKWVAPVVPVISRSRFMRRYKDTKNPPSVLLLQAIFLAGSRVCTNPRLMDANGSTTPAAMTFYKRAKALFEANYEDDRITIVQSLLLMGWYWEGPEDVTKNVFYWTRVAGIVAQGSGMHRSVENSQLSRADKRLWKRVWWTLFTRDRSVAVALGRPVMINTDDADVEMISQDDFIEDDTEAPAEYEHSSVHVQFFLQYVKLCEIMGLVLSQQYSVASKARRTNAIDLTHSDMALADWLQNCPREVYWERSRHHFWSALLHSNYYTTLCLLHRAHMPSASSHAGDVHATDMSYPSRTIAFQAAGMITSIIEELLTHDEIRYTPAFIVYSLFSALIMHVYQMRSSVPSVVSASQERINVCMTALKEVSKVWLVAKMVHTLFESILGNKVLEERLQKAAGKRAYKSSKMIQGTQGNTPTGRNQVTGKRKYDEIDLSFSNGPPAPQVSYERSRPATPSVTPSRDLGPQAPNLGRISSPPMRNQPEHYLPAGLSRGPSRNQSGGNTRPTSPFNGYSIPATPPDLFLVTRNSPPISQSLWENFQPDQLFPDGTSVPMPFSPGGGNPVDPQLQQMPTHSMPAPQSTHGGQQMHHHRDGSDPGLSGMPSQSLGVLSMGMGGMHPQSQQWNMDGGIIDSGFGGSQQDETWSNSSRGNAPSVPLALNVEDWFQFFGINGEMNGIGMDGMS